jgi:MazG family protein
LKSDSTAGEKFEELVALMARLRAPGGCPWDREQTFDSIKPYTLEETYEVLDAIDRRDWRDLAEELGDFVLQAVFYAQMAGEKDLFTIGDALDAINAKLIRRHPHVFGERQADSASDVLKIWGEAKAAEKVEKGTAAAGLLAAVPRALPALVEAQQITSRAARVGFDWENAEQVIEKLHEEMAEFDEARRDGSPAAVEDELGDLLFVLVNLARFAKVDPEQALRRTNGSGISSGSWRSAAGRWKTRTSARWKRCGRKLRGEPQPGGEGCAGDGRGQADWARDCAAAGRGRGARGHTLQPLGGGGARYCRGLWRGAVPGESGERRGDRPDVRGG